LDRRPGGGPETVWTWRRCEEKIRAPAGIRTSVVQLVLWSLRLNIPGKIICKSLLLISIQLRCN